ncbi:MAG: diacylglycerol/polyprenol kinase family protein [Anaerolineae bacterium]
MTSNDVLGLILSYVYAFGLLLTVEAVGKRLHWPQYLTRKIVHIGAGMWIWGIAGIFDTWIYGLIPFATFILLNYLFYRYQIFKAMDATDSSPGTIYFAISITTLFALLWRTDGSIDRLPIAAAAVMAMTWGDGVASIIGQSIGRHDYHVFGHRRSWEGTFAMAVLSVTVIFLTLWLLPDSDWSPNSPDMTLSAALLAALIGGSAATAAEALSPAGIDNLTVPLLTGAILYFLVR